MPWAALLVALVGASYFPALGGRFVWDDASHIASNPCIVGPLGLKAIWTTAAANYFPLTLTDFWLQHALWGLNPWPYHAVTLALHGINAVLLWRVLAALDVPGAWLGAALWALHPVQVESAAWICELKNTQSGLFFLLSILTYLSWEESESSASRADRTGRYLVSLLLGALAFLSKSSTVMLPAVLALCQWWRRRRLGWRDLAALLPFAALAAAASAWTIWEQPHHSGALGSDWDLTWAQRLVIAGNDTWFYLGKLLWPHPLLFVYAHWHIDPAHLLAWGPAGAVIATLAALWLLRRHGPGVAAFLAAVCFIVLLFPVLGFFPVYFFRYSFVADHFQYLASMSPLGLAPAALGAIPGLHPLGRRSAVIAVALGACAVLTWREAGLYRDSETLFRNILRFQPDSWFANYNLGVELQHSGRPVEAAGCYVAALRLKPNDATAENNLGLALAEAGHAEEAIAHYDRALQLDPRFAASDYNCGLALCALGRSREAAARITRALELEPVYPDAWDALGVCLYELGRLPEAVTAYRNSLREQPENPTARRNLAGALWTMGRTEEALRVDPTLPH